jgi:potassium-transporting ATPase KdpC subunit
MKNLAIALRLTIILLVIVSGIYPAFVWAVGKTMFPNQDSGSLIRNEKGVVIGSKLLAQNFTRPEYFHPRPSAAGSNGYDATASGGSNLAPTSAKLISSVKDLAATYRKENGLAPNAKVPVDAVTKSASGLDPDISLDNANIQALRISRTRGVNIQKILNLISSKEKDRDLGVFGETRVNVLELNLALDKANLK